MQTYALTVLPAAVAASQLFQSKQPICVLLSDSVSKSCLVYIYSIMQSNEFL